MSVRRFAPLFLAITASLACGAASAQSRASLKPAEAADAGPVLFTEAGKNAPERTVVVQLAPEAAASDVKIDLATADLDGDGRPEIVARLRSKTTCDLSGKRCRVIIARPDVREGWKTVFDRRLTALDTGQAGFGGVRSLRVDGRETWSWSGSHYAMDVASSGDAVDFKEAPAQARPLLVAQFGDAARRLPSGSFKVLVGAADLTGKGQSVVIARLEGSGVCGVLLGCPTRILQVKGGGYTTLLDGLTHGRVAVMQVNRDGWRDVVAELPRSPGRVVYGWSGQRYAVAERIGTGVTR
ncbi:hypothetical protein [Bosea sp. ANAM02]|uniref:hypothetical protein n=1 Tax=Bosea sp. ANAM02 TaxID=2020412 RepID=UPI00140EF7EA|nr:hypothetical protein [Bosea sp. ANAM02]BCB22149.1 hypothetical protein OCUBac02_50430 [Bosea sp. ANAM02]